MEVGNETELLRGVPILGWGGVESDLTVDLGMRGREADTTGGVDAVGDGDPVAGGMAGVEFEGD